MSTPIQVTRASMPPMEEYFEEISSVWESRWLTHTGPKHQQLQKELEKYLDVPNVALFSNGHMALELGIKALGLTGEIITTPFTFASTTQAIMRNGLTPVFCDIEPAYYTMDVDKIEALITEKTSAIMPVHVYGNLCETEKIERLAQKYGLKVIYDAAHAFGIKTKGKSVASMGDASMFSFHATKVYHTVEGGGLTFSDSSLQRELAALRQFGMYGKEDAEMIGTNAKMTEFHAAMGICNLRHIEEYISNRRQAALRYRERLEGVKGIRICPMQKEVESNFAYFPVVFEDSFGKTRDEVDEALQKENIFARKYFYPITSQFSACKERYTIQPTPVAEDIARRVLTVPLYSDLPVEDVDRICDVILK